MTSTFLSNSVLLCSAFFVHSPSGIFREIVEADVHHEVPARSVIHQKTYVTRSLETGKHVDQEGMTGRVDDFKNTFLTIQAARDEKVEETSKDNKRYPLFLEVYFPPHFPLSFTFTRTSTFPKNGF